jgi:hypothetical protein
LLFLSFVINVFDADCGEIDVGEVEEPCVIKDCEVFDDVDDEFDDVDDKDEFCC